MFGWGIYQLLLRKTREGWIDRMRYATPPHVSPTIRPVELAGWNEPASHLPQLLAGQARLGFVALAVASGFFAVSAGAQAGGVELPAATEEDVVSTASAGAATAPELSASSVSQPAPPGDSSLVSPQYQTEIPDINTDSAVVDTPADASVTKAAAPPSSGQPVFSTTQAVLDDQSQLVQRRTGERVRVKAPERTLVVRLAPRRHEARQPRVTMKRYHSLHLQYQSRSAISIRTENVRHSVASTLAHITTQNDQPTASHSSDDIVHHSPSRHSSKSQHIARQMRDQTRAHTSHLISASHRSTRRDISTKLGVLPARVERLASSLPQRAVDPQVGVEPRPAGSQRLTDERRLLQLGLVFGLAYVFFLVFWFWRTRDRRRGVGRVLRL